jgi:hypothetical protein
MPYFVERYRFLPQLALSVSDLRSFPRHLPMNRTLPYLPERGIFAVHVPRHQREFAMS